MQSSRRLALALLVAIAAYASRAGAQQQAQGFALERMYLSAPGGGWFVMDTLDLHGGLGGAVSLNLDYERDPLRVRDASHRLDAVSNQSLADIGFAITYRRWRLYLNLDVPIAITGQSGVIDGYQFTAPKENFSSTPDTLMDPRIGLDVRIFGGPKSRFRFGMGAQLFVPDYKRSYYVTDGTFRGMVRALFAGDVGRFTWAAQLGAHIRPVDDPSVPGGPKGSELLFGAAVGVRLPLAHVKDWDVVLGPEVFGASAYRAFFTANGTALEALLSARFEGTREDRMQVRVKVGAGAGLSQHFGAPEWRLTLAVEMFNRRVWPRSPPASR